MERKEFIEKYGKYLPETTEMYHVYCRNDLKKHVNWIQEAISTNSLEPFSQIFEYLGNEEYYYMGAIYLQMKEHNVEITPEIEEMIREYLWDSDKSDPIGYLIRNTGEITMYYSTGIYIHKDKEAAIYLKKLGLKKEEIECYMGNIHDGGELRIYFSDSIQNMIKTIEKDYIVFNGQFSVGIINSYVSSGWYENVILDNVKMMFERKNLFVSKNEKWGLGMPLKWCHSEKPMFTNNGDGVSIKVASLNPSIELMKKRKQWEKDAKKGFCHIEDPDFSHHEMEYQSHGTNGWKCKRCGRFVID